MNDDDQKDALFSALQIQQAVIAALDEHIAHIESVLRAAIAERFLLPHQTQPSPRAMQVTRSLH